MKNLYFMYIVQKKEFDKYNDRKLNSFIQNPSVTMGGFLDIISVFGIAPV